MDINSVTDQISVVAANYGLTTAELLLGIIGVLCLLHSYRKSIRRLKRLGYILIIASLLTYFGIQ